MKIANKITTIICDDVRSEVGNKFSLMGVYQRNIIFKKLPSILPKLCLCILIEKINVDLQECNITLKCPETEPTYLKLDLSEQNHIGFDVALFAMIVPFRAKVPGIARFELRFNKTKQPSIIHKFEIQQANQQS